MHAAGAPCSESQGAVVGVGVAVGVGFVPRRQGILAGIALAPSAERQGILRSIAAIVADKPCLTSQSILPCGSRLCR